MGNNVQNKTIVRSFTSSTEQNKTNKNLTRLSSLFIPKYRNFGEIHSIRNNVAQIKGLSNAFMSERIIAPLINAISMVGKIESNVITIIFLTNVKEVKPGMKVVRSTQSLGHRLSSFSEMLGKVVDTV